MAKRYLGYGYTNAQGVAKLEYDPSGNALSHSYTGVGAGKVDIVAESGTLQSETFVLTDALMFDYGSNTTDWFNYSNRVTRTTESGNAVLTNSGSNMGYYYCAMAGSSHSSSSDVTVWGSNDFSCEFDVIAVSDNTNVMLVFKDSGEGSEIEHYFSGLGITAGSHVKITSESGQVKFYVDDVFKSSKTLNLTAPFRFGFKIKPNHSVTYDNWICLPF